MGTFVKKFLCIFTMPVIKAKIVLERKLEALRELLEMRAQKSNEILPYYFMTVEGYIF